MTLAELLASARTCRRFKGSFALTDGILADLVNMTRFAPSARNGQILRYALVSGAEERESLFNMITLGGALKPEQRAGEHQHPGGYIVILAPREPGPFGAMDIGIAVQTINLAASAAGLACCMVGAFKKEEVTALVQPPEGLVPHLVLALAAPDEDRQICPAGPDGKTTYFRDDQDVHWVPKVALGDLIVSRL